MSTNTKCPCGSFYIPMGSKHNANGLSLRLRYYDAQTPNPSLLLNFNGENESISFIDSSPNNLIIIPYGGVTISASQSKWGGSSAYFDGQLGSYLELPDSSLLNLATDDFTIEFWLYNTGGASERIITTGDGVDLGYGWTITSFFIQKSDFSGNPTGPLNIGINGSNYTGDNSLVSNTWQHIAIIRKNGIFKVFIDGILYSTISDQVNFSIPPLRYIGQDYNYVFPDPLNGYLDDFRIIKGLSLYENNFSVPDKSFIFSYENLDLKLVHNQDAYLSSGEIFVSTSEIIALNKSIIIDDIILYYGNTYNSEIDDLIKVVCKSFSTKNIIGLSNLGSLNKSTQFRTNIISGKKALDINGSCVNSLPINLYNDRIQLEIHSICDFFTPACCDNTPSAMTLTNKVNNLSIDCCSTTTTTTTTTQPPLGACCERLFIWNNESNSYIEQLNCLGILTQQECAPYTSNDSQRVWLSGQTCESCDNLDFCSRFNLPDSFSVNVVGYGDFDGQESYVTFTKDGNSYLTYGVFPCGAYFELSMTCDEINEEFVYDGLVSCCDQSTKWILDPTKLPLIYPNARTPLIVGYTDCTTCFDCVTTTTSTTPPPLPCNDIAFGSLTINGYAFYRGSNRSVNIPGIGQVNIKCAGGHACDRTNFIPRLILDSVTIDGSPINVNNSNNGGDRDATFSFSVPDITLLQNGASIQLQCVTSNCHDGITAVVLTAEINGSTVILFNSCLVPGNIVPIDLGCPPIVGAGLGYTHGIMGEAPDGYSWNLVTTKEELYQNKVLITGPTIPSIPSNAVCGSYTLNQELSNNLAQWIRNGGIFYYQEEFVPCGNAFVANANMNIAGSKIFSEGGAWSELLGFPGYVATSFNIPCVGGLIFTGAATAKISGGIPLLYAPNSTNPGAIAMAGERIGNGYVILSGDSNLVQFSSSSWTEFLRRLLTLDQIL